MKKRPSWREAIGSHLWVCGLALVVLACGTLVCSWTALAATSFNANTFVKNVKSLRDTKLAPCVGDVMAEQDLDAASKRLTECNKLLREYANKINTSAKGSKSNEVMAAKIDADEIKQFLDYLAIVLDVSQNFEDFTAAEAKQKETAALAKLDNAMKDLDKLAGPYKGTRFFKQVYPTGAKDAKAAFQTLKDNIKALYDRWVELLGEKEQEEGAGGDEQPTQPEEEQKPKLQPIPSNNVSTDLPEVQGPPQGLKVIAGAHYFRQFSATGGLAPYHFQLETLGGFPPMGMILNVNGMLSGTPKVAGTYTFGVCAIDMAGKQSRNCGPFTMAVEEGVRINLTSKLCTPYGREAYSIEMDGTASGPVGTTLIRDPGATLTCGSWGAIDNSNYRCQRRPGDPEQTDWTQTLKYAEFYGPFPTRNVYVKYFSPQENILLDSMVEASCP